ncbi:hypothetical protein SAMN04490189_3970 [Pseudomonas koreensis]|uniref:hypothetical protein n=1 Tax=Pseudomonas koreensis TaxID=198620 RepID=UPI00087B3163|nr:hypothetical protein [Pseudomonas koreensis]KAB0515185.1 hypothetical protein F7R05_05880 [Pseudomonas koreensis]NNA60858.1 hypothetical protein [Pseudomonas koreensis]GGK24623.1 hypothetical protein GCM10009103_19810 [Pseudomonas koreensis]SDD99587.1 hypothetical protein SAMN04490189_3970 [Pseudomonas koreensis]
MLFWEWERLESYVEKNFFRISDPGKLLAPIRSVKIWRDHNLRLFMETKSAQHLKNREQEYPPGTVRMNEDAVEFISPGGATARAYGVDIRNTKSHSNHQHGTHETTQTCSLHNFETVTSRTGTVSYIFDWVANIDKGYYIWPDIAKDSMQEISTRTFGYGDEAVTLTTTSTDESGSRNCLDLNIGGFRAILGSTKPETGRENVKPGYILYIGDPDEETRKRIRDSLSFALGFPIVYLGCAKYSEKQELLSFKAINAYSMDGRAFNVAVMPPAPISTPVGSNMLDKGKLEKVATSFFANYNNYSLSSLNWVYWHAVTAPAHMAAAYFGAIIETIQKKYIDGEGAKFNNLIIPKREYHVLKTAIFEAIKDCDLTPEIRKVFHDKISNGNTISLKVRSQRFFEHINLSMGDAEVNAWQRRNDAAHGNELVDGDYISLIKDTKLLKLTLHRIILKITGASSEYYDYYSLNFPIRSIQSGVTE